MTRTAAEVASMIVSRGLEPPEIRDALGALAPEDAVAALLQQGYPQYAARGMELLGDRLATLWGARVATIEAYDRDADVLFGGWIAVHRARGTVLEPELDPVLRQQLGQGWGQDTRDLWRTALRAMPADRREALVLANDIRWDYLATCEPTPRVIERVVEAAARAAFGRSFDHQRGSIRAGLLDLGAPVGAEIARALQAGVEHAAARGLFASVLAQLRVEPEALRALCGDSDPAVRREARAGLEACGGEAPRTFPAPPQLAELRALRRSIEPAIAAAVRELAAEIEHAVRERDTTYPAAWLARALPTDPVRVIAVLADAWLDALRGRPYSAVYACGIRMCAETDDPLVAWCIADLMCRYPPEEVDPLLASLSVVIERLPPALEYSIACALGELLSPDDAGNPRPLYDWLVSRRPPVSPACPAIVHGARADDPQIRVWCERSIAGPPAPRPWSLDGLRGAFAAIVAGAHWGTFWCVAIDHELQDLAVALPQPIDGADRGDELVLETTLAGRLSPDDLISRLVPIVRFVYTRSTFEPGASTALDRDAARDRLAQQIQSDRLAPGRSDSIALAADVFAGLGDDLEIRELHGVAAGVAVSYAMTVQDAAGRFSLWLAYVNDQ